MEAPPGLKWRITGAEILYPNRPSARGFAEPCGMFRRAKRAKAAPRARIRNRVPVPSVRILPGDMFVRKPCGGRAVAFQWNYYEKHQKDVPLLVFGVSHSNSIETPRPFPRKVSMELL